MSNMWRGAWAFALGFVKEHTPQSSARLIAIVCCVVGGIVGLVAAATGVLLIVLTWRHAADVKVIDALSGFVKALAIVASGFIGGGAVAIVVRSRTGVGAVPAVATPNDAASGDGGDVG